MSHGFTSEAVRVLTPASSANLGPGFDSLGLALSLHDEITVSTIEGDSWVEVEGVGSGSIACDETHLVLRSMRAAFAAMDAGQPSVALRCRNVIPHGRGLGSSSAAIVGGIVAARGLADRGSERLSDGRALELASEIEGHPDNVAAALLGGLTIAWSDAGADGDRAVHLDCSAEVVVFVPPVPVPTTLARGLLPATVPHGDAARNAGRAGLLVAALQGHPELLLAGTEDALHQAYRARAMPDSFELMTGLRRVGIPAIISGAGPTVLAFVTEAADSTALQQRCPAGWVTYALSATGQGAHLA